MRIMLFAAGGDIGGGKTHILSLARELAGLPVYLSVDLDVLDPAELPGTGTPEAGGVSFDDLRRALMALGGLHIVGADMVELSPPCDASGVSTALACKLLRPGGQLFTFSCSAAMTPELFRKVIGDAARDAGQEALVLQTFTQAPDHPQSLNFPEGHYLTGLQLLLRPQG